MVIPYIYSTCWRMKLMFYERQHQPELIMLLEELKERESPDAES
jgi:hypothetical protein